MINKNSQKLFINPISSKERLKGFTIIEVLIVIAIIGLLTTIVLVSITSTRAKARDNRRVAELLTLAKSLEFYYSEHGQYPESTNWIKIEENTAFAMAMDPYISDTPEDPSYQLNGEYSYQYTTEATEGAEYKTCVTMETYEDSYCIYSVFGGSIAFDGGGGLDSINVGDSASASMIAHNAQMWLDDPLVGNYGGRDGGETVAVIGGDDDGNGICDADESEATFVLDAGVETANQLVVRHLDGISDDSFNVYVGGVQVGSYVGGQFAGEVWVTTAFDFGANAFTGQETITLDMTVYPWGSCSIYGQGAVNWAKITN